MKAKTIAVATGMMLATSAWAEAPADTAAPADSSAAASAASSPADATSPSAMTMAMPMSSAASTDSQFRSMQDNLNKMQELVGKMKDSTDPSERRALMAEYITAQHANMMIARNAMGIPSIGMMGGMGPYTGRKCNTPWMDRMNWGMNRTACRHGGMDMGPGMGMMGGMGPGMGGMGMGPGMGMMGGMGPGMGGMGMRHGMSFRQDEALSARIHSLEERMDVLQDMMKIMMER
jgi:hypothetical protein